MGTEFPALLNAFIPNLSIGVSYLFFNIVMSGHHDVKWGKKKKRERWQIGK